MNTLAVRPTGYSRDRRAQRFRDATLRILTQLYVSPCCAIQPMQTTPCRNATRGRCAI